MSFDGCVCQKNRPSDTSETRFGHWDSYTLSVLWCLSWEAAIGGNGMEVEELCNKSQIKTVYIELSWPVTVTAG